MQVLRVSDIPHGDALAFVCWEADGEPVIQLDASCFSEEQAAELAQRLAADLP